MRSVEDTSYFVSRQGSIAADASEDALSDRGGSPSATALPAPSAGVALVAHRAISPSRTLSPEHHAAAAQEWPAHATLWPSRAENAPASSGYATSEASGDMRTDSDLIVDVDDEAAAAAAAAAAGRPRSPVVVLEGGAADAARSSEGSEEDERFGSFDSTMVHNPAAVNTNVSFQLRARRRRRRCRRGARRCRSPARARGRRGCDGGGQRAGRQRDADVGLVVTAAARLLAGVAASDRLRVAAAESSSERAESSPPPPS